ncbi:MAG: hypothetical protein CL912_07215 [Deltaproteobacteria bacterium]|nr:hypothetical protein [Deltaproteobacteria bacterium]
MPDFTVPGAFDNALQHVSAIIHTATKLPGPTDPADIVPETIASMRNLLVSAAQQPSIKRVVYTGTIPIVFKPDQHYTQDRTTWADDAVAASEAPPPYGPDRIFVNYKAAKDGAEKAMFEFVEREKPNFTVNSVLPTCIFGRIIGTPSETGLMPKQLLKGEWPASAGYGRRLPT